MKQTNKRVYRAPLTATLDARVLVVTTKGSRRQAPQHRGKSVRLLAYLARQQDLAVAPEAASGERRDRRRFPG